MSEEGGEMLDESAPNSEGSTTTKPAFSVVVTAEGDGKGLEALLERYRAAMATRDEPFEFVIVYNHASSGAAAAAKAFAAKWPNVAEIAQRPWSGEEVALKIGVDRAAADVILTLPEWSEIDPDALPALIDELGDDDLVVGNRTRALNSTSSLKRGAFHRSIKRFFGFEFRDVFCRVRVGRRGVFRETLSFGVRQHFLPVIAANQGYRVRELALADADDAVSPAFYKVRAFSSITTLADLLALYVSLKFQRRPLRFFGAIGVPIFLIGLVVTIYLIVSKLVFGEPLADRPALVFSVMMLVLGVQIIAMGLVGEFVIYSASRRMRTYEIDEIIRGRPQG